MRTHYFVWLYTVYTEAGLYQTLLGSVYTEPSPYTENNILADLVNTAQGEVATLDILAK